MTELMGYNGMEVDRAQLKQGKRENEESSEVGSGEAMIHLCGGGENLWNNALISATKSKRRTL